MGRSYTTNASLAKLAPVNVLHDDFNDLKSMTATNADILELMLCGTTTLATNATIVNTAGARLVKFTMTSLAGSIATITGMVTGAPFTIYNAVSCATNHGICDVDPFKINGIWYPSLYGDNITLVWDGTSYIELNRTKV